MAAIWQILLLDSLHLPCPFTWQTIWSLWHLGEAVGGVVLPLFVHWLPTASPLPVWRHAREGGYPFLLGWVDSCLRRNDRMGKMAVNHRRSSTYRSLITAYGVTETGSSYQVGMNCTQVLPICRGKGVPPGAVKVSKSLRSSRCQVMGYCCPSRKMMPVPLPHS